MFILNDTTHPNGFSKMPNKAKYNHELRTSPERICLELCKLIALQCQTTHLASKATGTKMQIQGRK